jgi:hypothetical protein
MIAKIVNGQVVYPEINPNGVINGGLDSEYLQANGFSEIDDAEIENINKLNKSVFTKRQIRLALRKLGEDQKLKLILQNDRFNEGWSDAIEIDLNDSETQQALQLVQIDINAVKLAIE